jgi:Predicted nuclease of the RecB family
MPIKINFEEKQNLTTAIYITLYFQRKDNGKTMESIEDKIRDKLALHLDILEKEIVLLKKEAFLPNHQGTRGFVDILAKDSLGRFVIIELKRSKAASREAIHEILKYIENIKETKSLKNDEIIALIVSTEWEELLIPFSSFVEKAPYSVVGYKLTVDTDLTPLSATIVEPLKLKNERLLSDRHSIALYRNKENLEKGVKSHIQCYTNKNIRDFVLLILKANEHFHAKAITQVSEFLKSMNSTGLLNNKTSRRCQDMTI